MDNVNLTGRDYLYFVSMALLLLMPYLSPETLYSWRVVPYVILTATFPVIFEWAIILVSNPDEED